MTYTDAQIAWVCHEANRALQQIHLADGDRSIPVARPWWQLTEPERLRMIAGVAAARRGATPEHLHAEWHDALRAEGWVYGQVKNEVTHTHPCLKPYDQLPPEQRRKDHLFAAIVATLSGPVDAAEVRERWEAEADEQAMPASEPDAIREAHNAEGKILYGSELGDVPKVGRIVHYGSHGTPFREDGTQAYPARCRAAIVTEAQAYGAGLCVLNPEGQFFKRNVPADPGHTTYSSPHLCRERTYQGGTWHWPAQ